MSWHIGDLVIALFSICLHLRIPAASGILSSLQHALNLAVEDDGYLVGISVDGRKKSPGT